MHLVELFDFFLVKGKSTKYKNHPIQSICTWPLTKSYRGGCRSRSAEPELFPRLIGTTTLQVPTCVYFYPFNVILLNATLPHLTTSKSRNSTLPAPECVRSLPPTQDKHEDNKHNPTTKSPPTFTPNQWPQNHYTSIRPTRPILLPPKQQQ